MSASIQDFNKEAVIGGLLMGLGRSLIRPAMTQVGKLGLKQMGQTALKSLPGVAANVAGEVGGAAVVSKLMGHGGNVADAGHVAHNPVMPASFTPNIPDLGYRGHNSSRYF
jgi:hypothetical protein